VDGIVDWRNLVSGIKGSFLMRAQSLIAIPLHFGSCSYIKYRLARFLVL
jgi:hypothetical protein